MIVSGDSSQFSSYRRTRTRILSNSLSVEIWMLSIIVFEHTEAWELEYEILYVILRI